MSVDNVTVNSAKGVDGSSYTTSISNDQLTTQDFLKLMITELKLQDPTKPMDSQRMLDSQMQMSNINTNLKTIQTMDALSKTISQNALSTAANIIGKNIENGNVGENGVTKAYTVRSVETVDGKVTVKAQQILYTESQVLDKDNKRITYNIKGEILGADGKPTGNKVTLTDPGKPALKDGKPIILDKDNKEIPNSGYTLEGRILPVYSDKLESIPFDKVTKIF